MNKELLDLVIQSIEVCKKECFEKLGIENLIDKVSVINMRLQGADACTNGKVIKVDIEKVVSLYNNWDERLIHCIAHESRHVWQFNEAIHGDMWWMSCWENSRNISYKDDPLEKDAEEWASYFMSL